MNALLFVYLSLATCVKADIVGVWLTANEEVKIEIYHENSDFFGKVIWISKESDTNIRIGDIVLNNLKRNTEENNYIDGVFVYGDKKVNCSFDKLSERELQVKMKKGIWSNSVIWTKVEN